MVYTVTKSWAVTHFWGRVLSGLVTTEEFHEVLTYVQKLYKISTEFWKVNGYINGNEYLRS